MCSRVSVVYIRLLLPQHKNAFFFLWLEREVGPPFVGATTVGGLVPSTLGAIRLWNPHVVFGWGGKEYESAWFSTRMTAAIFPVLVVVGVVFVLWMSSWHANVQWLRAALVHWLMYSEMPSAWSVWDWTTYLKQDMLARYCHLWRSHIVAGCGCVLLLKMESCGADRSQQYNICPAHPF